MLAIFTKSCFFQIFFIADFKIMSCHVLKFNITDLDKNLKLIIKTKRAGYLSGFFYNPSFFNTTVR